MSPSIDRLSWLSDDVICHILSFLPTKISVSTGVLARRWRFLWTHVPNLYFVGYNPKGKTLSKGKTQDSDIIHRIMMLHQARTINTLHLSDVNCTEFQLATWITHAVNRGVRNLCVYFKDDSLDYSGKFTLHRCLFTCETLVDATLRCCRGVPSSVNVFLPSLKKLNLSHFMFEDNGSLPRLLSGCPVLEDLIVDWCENQRNGYDLDLAFISSPTVKKLDVDVEYGCRKLKINTPSLQYLNLRIHYLEDITYLNLRIHYLEDITSLTTMTSLIKAHISLIGDRVKYMRDINNTEHTTGLPFLNSLCNVKCLKFSIRRYRKGVSVVGLDSLVKFDNLIKLEFDLLFDFDEILKFLQVADNLQVLTFTLCARHNTYMVPKQVPTCVLSSLKTVGIKLSDGFNARCFNTIKYLLRNAQVLEKMEIRNYSYLCSKMKRCGRGHDMLCRIPLLEKGSKSCKLVLY